ncbi:MAG: hypothetical protein HPY83_17730 [Anaerolineae bacterium]|nr:hypothetical protein [Anaerolineae bacterium]
MTALAVQVGSAAVDITPPLSIPHLGFLPRQGRFTGVNDPLLARAFVFQEGGERIALLCADSLGFGNHILGPGRHFTDELRARVSDRCGLVPGALMLSTTHAHSTPETLGITRLLDAPAAGPWLEVLLDQLASAVEMACGDLRPCRLKVGRGQVLGVARNRRPSARGLTLEEQVARGKLDPELQVLVCQDEEGQARQVLLNFQCHPVTMQVQPLISADYPGVATGLVQRSLPGCKTCGFVQGAAGNLNPLRGDSRDYRDVILYGTMVAGEALKVAARLLGDDGSASRTGTIAWASERVSLPPRPPVDRAEWEGKLREAQARERAAASDRERREAAQEARRAREALDVCDYYDGPQEAEVQVLRLGDLAIASNPGEMFTQWGLKIKRESAAPHTFVAELTNGWVGYLLDPGGFEEGGYEASPGPWTQVGEEAGAILSQAAIRLIARLWR